MFRSVTKFIKNVVKAKIENIFAIALVLLVLFTAMMDPYISFSIAVALLVALAIYGFVKRQNKRGGIEMANQFERRAAKIVAPFSLSAVLFILSYLSLKDIESGFYSILLLIIGVVLAAVGIAAIFSEK